ncbi:MAG: CDP-alcohol phosphatidyltransferase family protein [Bacteroidota bacterium]
MQHKYFKQNSLYELLFLSGYKIALVNFITLYRVLAAPILLYYLLNNEPIIFKWLLLVSFLTDAIDGYLARRLNAATTLGSMLDSLGDVLTIIVAVAGVIYTRSEFVAEQYIVIICVCSLFILQIIFALIRYKRLSSFHTYLAKISAVMQGTFLLSLFFFNDILYPLFYLASAVTTIELIEEIILIYLIPQWEADVRGIYWYIVNKIS